jgi:hypothetical protein
VDGRGSTLVSLVSELAIAANARPDCPLSRGTHDLWDCLQQNNEGVLYHPRPRTRPWNGARWNASTGCCRPECSHVGRHFRPQGRVPGFQLRGEPESMPIHVSCAPWEVELRRSERQRKRSRHADAALPGRALYAGIRRADSGRGVPVLKPCLPCPPRRPDVLAELTNTRSRRRGHRNPWGEE